MKIDEAIKEMELHQPLIELGFYHEYAKAHQLGIEALKKLKASRVRRLADFTEQLPGETEE